MAQVNEGLGVALKQMQRAAGAYPYAERAEAIMARPENARLEWAQRFQNKESAPVLWNADGTPSTHSLASGEADGRGVVWPTVVPDGQGGLRRLEDAEAVEYSRKNRNAMWFDTPGQGLEFSQRYKDAWRGWTPTRQ